ncbi:outer membrane beta-barrel protein [Polluticaenibacter yanchengensis]|uniref:Outer membrane protein beta-barrel domain-containing protein n=1 Tax=Polluticaenibacter yanchengensis TaxID=3014562 RepID=A0ABT4UP35_9BACT|nr:hypothetical protein [Chitinophagaceae bacterium LY-5]
MSQSEANKKNTSQPFSIDSDAGWASMSKLLDEQMPVLPAEDEKKKKRRWLVFFPILAAASVISFFLITPEKSTSVNSGDKLSETQTQPFAKEQKKPADFSESNQVPVNTAGNDVAATTNSNTPASVPGDKSMSNIDLAAPDINSNPLSQQSDPAGAIAGGANIGSGTRNIETLAAIHQNAQKTKRSTTKRSPVTNTSGTLNANAVFLNADAGFEINTLNSSPVTNINTDHSDTYTALQSGAEQNLDIAALSRGNVTMPDANDKMESETTVPVKRNTPNKKQFEWMAGMGVEKGLNNKNLGYHFTSKIMLPLSGKFSLSTGLVLLNGNGNVVSEDAYTKTFDTNTSVVKNVTKTTTFKSFKYLSVPVSLVYKIKPELYIGAGIQNSFLIKYKETENLELYDGNMNFLSSYPTADVDVGTIRMGQIEPATKVNKYDPRLLATVGYVYKHLRVEVNYERGIKNAVKSIGYTNIFNTGKAETLGVSLFYNLK